MRLPAFLHRPDGAGSQVWTDGDDRQSADTLRTYATESLSPDAETLARMGSIVRAAFVESQLNRTDATPAAAVGRTWSTRRTRAFASLCAVAILTLSSVGFVGAQSNPGQPFYRLRLGLEGVNLPFAGQANQLDSNLSRADARLAEVAAAAAAKDWNAAADAAGAYRDVIVSMSLPVEPAERAAALQRLDRQLARLEELRTTSKSPETAAMDKAIGALCSLLGIPVPTPTPAPPSVAHPTATKDEPQPSPRDPDRPTKSPDAGNSDRPGHTDDPRAQHATPTPFDPFGGPRGIGGHRRRH